MPHIVIIQNTTGMPRLKIIFTKFIAKEIASEFPAFGRTRLYGTIKLLASHLFIYLFICIALNAEVL